MNLTKEEACKEGSRAILGLVRWLDNLESAVGRKQFIDLMPNDIYGRSNAIDIARQLSGLYSSHKKEETD